MKKKMTLMGLAIATSTSLLVSCVSTDTTYTNSSKVYGENKTNQQRNYSFPLTTIPTGQKEFIFNPATLMWAAYDANGNLVNQGPASGGRDFCTDINRACRTPTGTFHILKKGSEDCKSNLYPVGVGGSPMPFCMYFGDGYAVHGSYDVPNYNASHGCVRVEPPDAEWLSDNFMTIGTRVTILPYE